MTRGQRLALAGLAAVALAWWGVDAAAQGPEVTDDQVNQIAKGLYCPVCENVPLDVCPTLACAQWRETIRRLLAEGRTEEEIRQYFVERYGARVLAVPPAAGLNWMVYVIPPAAFLAGVALLWNALRGGTSSRRTSTTDAEGGVDPYLARVEEELRRRGRSE